MEGVAIQELPTNWQNIMRDSFTSQWKSISNVDISSHNLNTISSNFNLIGIEQTIEAQINKSTQNKDIEKHTQIINLERLAKLFAIILYETSSEGKEITVKTISDAKILLKNDPSSIPFPC